ncbi:b(0,+)-type amino acid transporter 1 [Callorhinchus milii]|nr:b(0,+)-type amino acid transporter 1 [Callorhinchus milii]
MEQQQTIEVNSNEVKEIDNRHGEVHLKRTIGYFSGVNFITGTIIGSGIFVSPGGVLRYSQLNVGVALMIWLGCGILSTLGALCYAELGAALPSSGGEYFYLKRALGSIPAYLSAWTMVIFTRPATSAAKALTFAEYVVQPFYSGCPPPEQVKKTLAATTILVLGILNCLSVRWATRVQNIFTVLKILALTIISLAGVVLIAMGRTENLTNAFSGDIPSVSQIGEAFYQGLWAYGGWNTVNYLSEELKSPAKNIPRCILTSVPSVSVFYVLVNLSYLTVLTPTEIVSSGAVAVTWADRVILAFSWIIPLSVAISTFGSINSTVFVQGRLNFAVSREGHLPIILSMLHTQRLTPVPAIILSTILSIIFIIPTTLLMLTNYSGFISWLLIGLTCVSLIVLRFKEPHLLRPYKVFLPVPFLMVAASVVFVVSPLVQSPRIEYIYVLIFIIGGLVFYFPFVHFKLHFKCFDTITCFLQLFLEASPPDVLKDMKTQ